MAQFFSHFGPQNRSKFQSLVIFTKIFHWFHISLGFKCQFELLLEVCWISAPEAQFPAILGPEIDYNSGLQSFSQIFSTDFAPFLLYMLIRDTFRCISIMCPKGLFSGPRVKVAAELVRPSGLWFLLSILISVGPVLIYAAAGSAIPRWPFCWISIFFICYFIEQNLSTSMSIHLC